MGLLSIRVFITRGAGPGQGHKVRVYRTSIIRDLTDSKPGGSRLWFRASFPSRSRLSFADRVAPGKAISPIAQGSRESLPARPAFPSEIARRSSRLVELGASRGA